MNIHTSKSECIKVIRDFSKITNREVSWIPKTINKAICSVEDPINAIEVFLRSGETSGFHKLITLGRLDLTLETFVLDPRYTSHFNEDVIRLAKKRIDGVRSENDNVITYWNEFSNKI